MRAVVVVAFAVMVAVNGVAGATTWLGGAQTGEVSDALPSTFTPAGYAFSTWSLIYLLLLGFVIAQFRDRDGLERLRRLFVASCVLNVAWLLAWQYRVLWLSVLVMLALLAVLALCWTLARSIAAAGADQLWLRIPFSVYFGWISVATLANITAWLVASFEGWFRSVEFGWTCVALAIGLAAASLVVLRTGDRAYLAVIIWAFVAIIVANASDASTRPAAIAAGVAVAALLALAALNEHRLATGRVPARAGVG